MKLLHKIIFILCSTRFLENVDKYARMTDNIAIWNRIFNISTFTYKKYFCFQFEVILLEYIASMIIANAKSIALYNLHQF